MAKHGFDARKFKFVEKYIRMCDAPLPETLKYIPSRILE